MIDIKHNRLCSIVLSYLTQSYEEILSGPKASKNNNNCIEDRRVRVFTHLQPR